MSDPVQNSTHEGFRPGRIIRPGTPRQLGTFGLFPPPAARQRTLTVAGRPLVVKSADADLLWVSFHQLVEGPVPAADCADLAAQFGTWVVDDVPAAPAGTAGSPAWQRFHALAEILFAADATLFLVGASPPVFGPDSPLSLLLRAESDEELAAKQESGS
jgi:AFG1-like ATPase